MDNSKIKLTEDQIVEYIGTDGKKHKGKLIRYRTMSDGKATCIVIKDGQVKPASESYTYYDTKPYGTIKVASVNFPIVLKTHRLK